MAQALKTYGRTTIIFHQKTPIMKNIILSSLFAAMFSFALLPNIQAQDSVTSSQTRTHTHTHIDIQDDDGPMKWLRISESETDNSYEVSLRFTKENTVKIRKYLAGLLGDTDSEVGGVRQVWNHMPDGAIIDDLKITLREGSFSIKAKDGCCPGDMDELKAISEDIVSMLE